MFSDTFLEESKMSEKSKVTFAFRGREYTCELPVLTRKEASKLRVWTKELGGHFNNRTVPGPCKE